MNNAHVNVAFNDGNEDELVAALPPDLSGSPLPHDDDLRKRMVLYTGVHPFLDYVFLVSSLQHAA